MNKYEVLGLMRLCELELRDSPRSAALVLSSCRQLWAMTGVKTRHFRLFARSVRYAFYGVWLVLAHA